MERYGQIAMYLKRFLKNNPNNFSEGSMHNKAKQETHLNDLNQVGGMNASH